MDIQEKLKKRTALRDEKVWCIPLPRGPPGLPLAVFQAFLHLLLKISESVSRLESLLLIKSPDTTSSSDNLDAAVTGPMPDDDQHDERVRGNRAKHLSRVASEYTQLLYHISKANAGKCAFIIEIQWV